MSRARPSSSKDPVAVRASLGPPSAFISVRGDPLHLAWQIRDETRCDPGATQVPHNCVWRVPPYDSLIRRPPPRPLGLRIARAGDAPSTRVRRVLEGTSGNRIPSLGQFQRRPHLGRAGITVDGAEQGADLPGIDNGSEMPFRRAGEGTFQIRHRADIAVRSEVEPARGRGQAHLRLCPQGGHRRDDQRGPVVPRRRLTCGSQLAASKIRPKSRPPGCW